MFDLSRLGAWCDLPFFEKTLPRITLELMAQAGPFQPPAPVVFRALELAQPKDVRVVILGQDPYHTARKADGLAFSIPEGFGGRLGSLGNIFKEIRSDLDVIRTRTDLGDWADQGVLLLNTILTVPSGMPKGHNDLGWQQLTFEVFRHLSDQPRAYLLWGGPAQKAAQGVDPEKNLKIETAHPSPLSAYRGFLGSRPFSRTNEWLRRTGHGSINWHDPEAS